MNECKCPFCPTCRLFWKHVASNHARTKLPNWALQPMRRGCFPGRMRATLLLLSAFGAASAAAWTPVSLQGALMASNGDSWGAGAGATNLTVFQPSCMDTDQHGWPRFESAAELARSPWANYYAAIYGEVPLTGYPLCVFDLWNINLTLAKALNALPVGKHIHTPLLVGDKRINTTGCSAYDPAKCWQCPSFILWPGGLDAWVAPRAQLQDNTSWPSAFPPYVTDDSSFLPEGELFERITVPPIAYWGTEQTGLHAIYHEKRPTYGNDTWIEITHSGGAANTAKTELAGTSVDLKEEANGMWLSYAPGSGIWFNTGSHAWFDHHDHASRVLCGTPAGYTWLERNLREHWSGFHGEVMRNITDCARVAGLRSISFRSNRVWKAPNPYLETLKSSDPLLHAKRTGPMRAWQKGSEYYTCTIGATSSGILQTNGLVGEIELLVVEGNAERGLPPSGVLSCGASGKLVETALFRAGWRAKRPCLCNNSLSYLNCLSADATAAVLSATRRRL